MTKTLNPAWIKHNALYNEGGEGYNPHPKYVMRQPAKPSVSSRMVKDERGNLIPSHKLAERLAQDEARLQTITDDSARAIVIQSIEFARAALA